MDLFNRLQGILFNPKVTLKAISEKPIWIDALIILLIAWVLFSFIIAPYAQKDQLKILKNNDKLIERMGEDRFNEMIERAENPSQASIILRNLVLNPGGLLIGFLFSSLIILAMSRMFSTEGNYKQIFSAILHANFIDKILGNALRLVLILTRKSVMQTTTSLALFFPKLEMTSPTFIILSQIDFFQIWLFGILGYGLSSIFKIELKKALILSYTFWVLKSLLYIALGLLGAKYMG
ncbi:hypothetical protein LCGC14_0490070 [marine sediment metagenome]|jgi:hypothetical protein|uniref:Yip1 domain-containing protein n=1 Tax=marine sediment metagenome TaxID=412755 RepID=A0A0F9UTR4_9ZZZZ|nr:hypothetical protein [Candidatus Aminicenantes bacterium]